MSRTRTFIGEERGAVIIQAGIAILVLMAFNVFVLDYGMMWIARGQAQNAADAGALAGATARAYDDRDDPPHRDGFAAQSSRSVARANLVWRQAGTPVVSFDCPPGVTANCTRVDVYRDGANGSTALPAFFGPIIGVTTQRVRATATAVNANGNATPCLRPIAFPDGWHDRIDAPPTGDNEFTYYDAAGNALPEDNRDDYTPPSNTFPGHTRISVDYGERLVWNISPWPVIQAQPITRTLLSNPSILTTVLPLTLPSGSFHDNMVGCVGRQTRLNETLPIDTGLPPGELSNGIRDVFLRDPDANYDYDQRRIINSCAPGPCGSVSPRLIPIVLYDPRRFQLGLNTGEWSRAEVGCPTNAPCVTISNIVGFFIHRIAPSGSLGAHGHMLRYPGATAATIPGSGGPTFVDDASWLVTTHLIR
jgi:Flp pilus assembly protein TadG